MRNPLRFKTTFLLLFISFGAFSQKNDNIKGKITTTDGRPAVSITISFSDKNQTAVSNDKGEYTFNRVKPGTYSLPQF